MRWLRHWPVLAVLALVAIGCGSKKEQPAATGTAEAGTGTPGVARAKAADLFISNEDLKSKYGWDGSQGVWNAGEGGVSYQVKEQGTSLTGSIGFGNLKIEGTVLVQDSGIVLKKGSTLSLAK